jgi:L-fucose isomerase-like protein
MTVRIAKSLADHHVPLLLWAVPDARDGGRLRLNSLCGINLAAHALRQQGVSYETLYCTSHDPSALTAIEPLVQAGHASRTLRGANVGVIGEHPDGFETCAYDQSHLRQLFGVVTTPVGLTSFLQRAAAANEAGQPEVVLRFADLIENMGELDVDAVSATAGVYAALCEAADEARLSGIAVRCWPEFFTELNCAACGAMSMLSEEGCPASCEADVNGTVTSMLLQALSGSPAFITDLVSVDTDSDTAVLWHCGLAPVSMADPEAPLLGTVHSNRKRPLLFEFPLKPGRVTVARLHRMGLDSGLDDYRLVIGAGDMVRAPKSFGGTSGVLRFDRPAAKVLKIILGHGLEHHLNITYGDHSEALRAFAKLIGLPVIELTA